MKNVNFDKSIELIQNIKADFSKVIIGQNNILEKILIALFTSGHVLLEGVPGLGKTKSIKTISEISGLDFARIQFTPDLLPADILGTQIYNQKSGEFSIKKGPLFSNMILADEINRAPSKVQSALLESMEERQITIGQETFKLPENYIVMATQNPLEQEGTYPLPEAQVDRFMLKIKVNYPSVEEEKQIVKDASSGKVVKLHSILNTKKIAAIRNQIESVYMDEKIIDYVVKLVHATRYPAQFGINANLLVNGASPRASISLIKASKAMALINGENFVKTEDIKEVAFDVLRHRLIPSYEAEAEEITSEDIVNKIFEKVETP